MAQASINWIVDYIWNIADDVLHDLYVRGKYRDVILPMTVLRRFDAVLESTKQAVLEQKDMLDEAEIVHQDIALRQAIHIEELVVVTKSSQGHIHNHNAYIPFRIEVNKPT